MVRLAALHEAGQRGAEALECPVFEDKPFVQSRPVRQSRVALVSTAGLISRGDPPFRGGDAGYRALPDSLASADILISHISINFDRSAAVMSLESVFPRELLGAMAGDGEVGSAAKTHYSFMGATDPLLMEDNARQLAQSLHSEGVDSAVLLPV